MTRARRSRAAASQARILEAVSTFQHQMAPGRRVQDVLDAVVELIALARQNQIVEPAPAPIRDKLERAASEKAGQLPRPEDLSEAERKVVESLQMIEFGTWLEFDGGRRLKVAWFNGRTSHYMLVDQMGKRAAVMTGAEIAREMLAKKARIIAGSSKPFFDRALENIFEKLNAQAEAQARDPADDPIKR